VSPFDSQPSFDPPPAETQTPGEQIAYAGANPPAEANAPERVPHVLRWRDLLVLVVFYLLVGALFFQIALAAASSFLRTTPEALQQTPTAYVAVVAVSQALHSVAMLALLYVMVRSRTSAPFWTALGWRPFPAATPRAALAARYMLAGAGLAIVTQAASYRLAPDFKVPMEELFRNRPSVLMMMALGILVAPLLEETLFRGCLYPLLARAWGIPAGVILTGAVFGLAHSLQLAGAWSQVALLSTVGVIFTYIRARSGTVVASYFVHLGYNSLLFVVFYFATGGLRNFPVR
jgi:membrane protease YdiL (CAAX protease family)